MALVIATSVVKKRFILAGLCVLAALASAFARADVPVPSWPYGTDPAWRAAAKLPGGERVFDELERNLAPLDPYAPPDRYPNDHPPMPELVARGSKADHVLACALCHHPDGYGRPENADLRGLRADYIVKQLEAFKNGERWSADPAKANTRTMISAAKGLTHAEMLAVAAYYAGLHPWQSHERVVESSKAPDVWSDRTGAVFALAPPNNGWAPLAHAIVEIPQDAVQSEVYHDPREIYVVYAPPGSVERGKLLAATASCGACHGGDLGGSEIAPPLAGRSASYIARQLFDIQRGTRRDAPAMIAVVAHLTPDDVVDLAAYLASLGSKDRAHGASPVSWLGSKPSRS
ncbi:MAG TPA: c-type cytochrome [Verrucomicrobiae bacterium]|nr:c-type cytochrome [Verrucomicrobiae bacterium]